METHHKIILVWQIGKEVAYGYALKDFTEGFLHFQISITLSSFPVYLLSYFCIISAALAAESDLESLEDIFNNRQNFVGRSHYFKLKLPDFS